ncbi:MAG: acetylxylan esterase, partial [Armatimonadetes bacterium]|nr:acetylxylan esterase [Armatimonadota bacterium]
MADRNFSMIEYFNRIAAEHEPELAFHGSTKADFDEWHAKAHAKYMELLGEFPRPVELNAEVVFSVEEDGIVRERVVFDAEEHMSVPAVVLRPADMKPDGSNAAILCSHGHGRFGKEPVAGNRTVPGMVDDINAMNYDYGWQMAKAGYLTISPDLRVFGERSDGGDPYPGRDKCNVHFIRGAIMGIWTLTLNIFDMMRCIDYLQTRPEVDPERIGMMGLSQGGTMTTWTTAAEPRIKAADIIGYLNPWERFGVNRANFCGSQIVPEIYKYFDTHDIAGLIAPRPLLVEAGVHDLCFFIDDQQVSIEAVRRIYEAAGA